MSDFEDLDTTELANRAAKVPAPQPRTGREHLDWCIERAMVYAVAGDWPNAWASFISDVRKDPGTAYIADDEWFRQAFASGLWNIPEDFRRFLGSWPVPEER